MKDGWVEEEAGVGVGGRGGVCFYPSTIERHTC